jgi:HlyD family secretion protein
MMIEVTPSTVKREEYGYIIGKVEYVSDFPATHEGMMRLLHNQSLVDQLSNQGTSVQMFASLTLDPGSVSGFKWSSRKSPPLEMSSGTLCSGSVVVRERPPITLVVPLLKRFFGLT